MSAALWIAGALLVVVLVWFAVDVERQLRKGGYK
jgi:hypothetical protein